MKNRTVIITGGTNGIGRECVAAFAERDATVIFTGRDRDAGTSLAGLWPGKVFFLETDFGDLNSVLDTSNRINNHFDGFDVLLTNAGAKIESPLRLTSQGFEWHFGVNYLANFLISHSLKSRSISDSILVNVSSIVAKRQPPTLDLAKTLTSPSTAYANSKALNLLNRPIIRGSAQTTAAAHPGFTRAKNYGPWWLKHIERVFAQSSKSGARPIIDAALQGQNGDYFAPRLLEIWGAGTKIEMPTWFEQVDREAIYLESRSLIENAGFNLPPLSSF